jgi:hypothetical protein
VWGCCSVQKVEADGGGLRSLETIVRVALNPAVIDNQIDYVKVR